MENNNNFSLQENIQTLVTGEVGELNRQELLDKISAQPEGAEELAFSKSLALLLQHQDTVAAAAIIRAVMKEEAPPPTAAPSLRPWLLGGVVLLMVMTVSFVFLWQINQPKQHAQIEDIEALENVFFLAGANQTIGDLQRGMAAYDAGQYDEAERFLQLYTANNSDYAARLYLGVARLLSGKTTKAIKPLQEAVQSPEPPVKEAAQWYLALALLNSGQPDAARSILLDIPAESIYADNAKRALEKIK